MRSGSSSARRGWRGRWQLGLPLMADFFERVSRGESSARPVKSARVPWWALPTSARRGFQAAGAYLFLAVVALILSFFVSAAVIRIFTLLWLVLGAWWLASALVARRQGKMNVNASRHSPGREDHESDMG